ncbi:MAG: hypothetical protein JSW04_14990 [Desulfobacterales bacterium]|nr:MAG: hypothetical protein JSW04_14990 [Desulfobacterales bacterium]
MNDIKERRQQRRFRVQAGAYAVLNNGSLKLVQIQNIRNEPLFIAGSTPGMVKMKAEWAIGHRDGAK